MHYLRFQIHKPTTYFLLNTASCPTTELTTSSTSTTTPTSTVPPTSKITSTSTIMSVTKLNTTEQTGNEGQDTIISKIFS